MNQTETDLTGKRVRFTCDIEFLAPGNGSTPEEWTAEEGEEGTVLGRGGGWDWLVGDDYGNQFGADSDEIEVIE